MKHLAKHIKDESELKEAIADLIAGNIQMIDNLANVVEENLSKGGYDNKSSVSPENYTVWGELYNLAHTLKSFRDLQGKAESEG